MNVSTCSRRIAAAMPVGVPGTLKDHGESSIASPLEVSLQGLDLVYAGLRDR
jgi:hypothetical protein